MRINKVALNGFRNYDFETAEFSPNINVICGANAQGKTNLLEAVYMLTAGRSFRTRFDGEIIGFSSSISEILAEITAYDREQTVKIRLNRGFRKQISVNGVSKKQSELAGVFFAVLFSPDDLEIVKGGAAQRRRLMDNAIGQLRPAYSKLLTEYSRVLEQKTAILKGWREKNSLLLMLDDFSDRLCHLSAAMVRYRASFVKRLNCAASPIAADFSEGGDDLALIYKTVSTVKNPCASEKDIYYEICMHQEAHRQRELESGQCLTGAHRDDIEIIINEKPARSFASQGQTRTAALSLKLAEREIFLEDTGEYPVLLLDDVLSELDERRQAFVLNRIVGGQTLITCCSDVGIKESTGGRVLYVQNGRIRHVPPT